MLTPDNTTLIVIDVQEKLSLVMHEKERFLENLKKLIQGAQILGIPIILTEQNPKGLGPTIPEVAQLLPDHQPIAKFSFSCCGDGRFNQQLEGLGRRKVLLAGIETHVCIYQTSMDLISSGYEVQVVADAVASRTAENKQIGLEKVRSEGASLTSTETALFELLKVAEGAKFKEIVKLVK